MTCDRCAAKPGGCDTLNNQRRTRTWAEDKLRDLRPYHPQTKADPEKSAQVDSLRHILGQLNEAISAHFVPSTEEQRLADGRLF